jgi:acid phosphatase (class A)
MKKIIILSTLLFCSVVAFPQKHMLAEVSDHYKTLRQLSGDPNPSRAWMDTIQYPTTEYGSSIVYLLVKPHYLSEGEIKAISESVKFPANSSDQTRKELDYLLELQDARTPTQAARAEFLGNIGYWPSINMIPTHPLYQQNLRDLLFEGREVLTNGLDAPTIPKTTNLLQGIMQDMRVMEFTIKYKFYRPRPYHLDPKLQPLMKINSPSFPSGHTLWAFLQAFVWGEIIPEKQGDFIALAEEIRRSREIMGIHYPSDNETSRQIAYKMLQYYLKKDDFKNDLKEAIREWKSVTPALVR